MFALIRTWSARRVGGMLLVVSLLLSAAGASVASASGAQQPFQYQPLVVVESFLAARNARDPVGATEWCAELLALHDVDGEWYVDQPTTRYWLRQLTDRYRLDALSPPILNGNVVTWTERLTPFSRRPSDPWSGTIAVEVIAVVQDGRIVSLSAPYPPLPLRPPRGEVEDALAVKGASVPTTVAPATLFLGWALGLSLTALAVAYGAPVVRAVRRSQSQP